MRTLPRERLDLHAQLLPTPVLQERPPLVNRQRHARIELETRPPILRSATQKQLCVCGPAQDDAAKLGDNCFVRETCPRKRDILDATANTSWAKAAKERLGAGGNQRGQRSNPPTILRSEEDDPEAAPTNAPSEPCKNKRAPPPLPSVMRREQISRTPLARSLGSSS